MAATCQFYKYRKYVSYDNGVTWQGTDEYQRGELYQENSPLCGGGTTMYQWVNIPINEDWICEGTTKYYKQKKQYSYDGSTWYDVIPYEYQRGRAYEYQSTDCGYVPAYSAQYLTFVAEESGTFKFSGTSGNDSILYTLDSGSTWTSLASGANTPTINVGQKIMWKGELIPNTSSFGIGRFSSSGQFKVQGNAHSLLFGDNFSGTTDLTGKNTAFAYLFSGCTGVTSAENLVLPATGLTFTCYLSMFSNCTSLTTAPQLPATTLAYGCYYAMFGDCNSLTTAPELPATTLATSCYNMMFYSCRGLTTAPSLPASNLRSECYYMMFANCKSLTTAPELPALTLPQHCYNEMFNGCTNLNYVKCLATTISYSNCIHLWLNGVSSTGTFVKNSSMTDWPSGTSGIPTGWTVQDA